jgi:ABC-type phosphate transport system substrate-binding protein
MLGVGAATAAVATMLLAGPASATNISHSGDVITSSGSDTTEAFMNQVMTNSNKEYNVPTISATKFHVPGDAHCSNPGPSGDPQADAGISWSSDPAASASGGVGVANGTSVLVAPNGSGDGREALTEAENHKLFKNSTTFGTGGGALNTTTDNACFDIARSSGDPRATNGTTESTNFQYYAFAIDDVTVASPSREAPSALTIQQIRDIFNCTITDWSQVPGNPGKGPIQRFFPSSSSGTGDTFIRKVLGGDDPRNHVTAQCPAVLTIEENRGDRFVTSTADPNSYSGFLNQAILPFSAGKWEYFANNYFNPTIDIRGGVRLIGQVPSGATAGTDPALYPIAWNGTAGLFRMDQSDALHVSESNPNITDPTDTGSAGNKHISGVRYLYNVLDSAIASSSFTAARQIAGFDPAANPSATTGGICAGTYGSTIIDQGFGQLPAAIDSGSATTVRCRKDPTPRPLTTTVKAYATGSPRPGAGGTAIGGATPGAAVNLSRTTTPSVSYEIVFGVAPSTSLTQAMLQFNGITSGQCTNFTTVSSTVFTIDCTPSANGVFSVTLPQGVVTAPIGAFPSVPNQLGQSGFLNSQP